MNEMDELSEVFASINEADTIKKLFEELFTESEKQKLKLRWALLKNLYEGKSQREISANLKISLCKITRGSKILKNKDSSVKNILDKLYNNI